MSIQHKCEHHHVSMHVHVLYTIKQHFYERDKLMQICQNRPLDKFMFMCSSTFAQPMLDLHNSHKSRAEISLYSIHVCHAHVLGHCSCGVL